MHEKQDPLQVLRAQVQGPTLCPGPVDYYLSVGDQAQELANSSLHGPLPLPHTSLPLTK
jgi:hypothetical protein